ncbi:hypothetical protein NAI81_11460, partial [Francisella tularensis subsp. holarctica]|nr:hypothetical protein [Francisella tularensis subsp. holarctica]
PRIPGISYQTHISSHDYYDLYLVLDLQDDGVSSDIPAAEIFNNKNLRRQYFSDIQNKVLDMIVVYSLDSVIGIKYLDGD